MRSAVERDVPGERLRRAGGDLEIHAVGEAVGTRADIRFRKIETTGGDVSRSRESIAEIQRAAVGTGVERDLDRSRAGNFVVGNAFCALASDGAEIEHGACAFERERVPRIRACGACGVRERERFSR